MRRAVIIFYCPKTERSKSVSDISEDEQFWRETVKDIRPVKQPLPVTAKVAKKRVRSDIMRTVPLKIYSHEPGLGTTADIDRATMRRFKREEFKIEARLDLHGLNEDQAYDAVRRFITDSYLGGKRCVIIITGKGLAHPDEDIFAARGVLRDRVPQWLTNDDNLRPLILSFIHPSERLGGRGALYILLRRSRT